MANPWNDIPWLAALEADSARVLELARSGDLSTPIVHLNRWKARDLVAHLGGVQRWATRVITTSTMDGPGSPKSKLDGEELCDWFEDGAAKLVAAMRSKDPSDACPNFNPGSENVVSWWARRQCHETAVHRWDIESAFDDRTPIEPTLAADGVDEFLDVFVRTRGKQTLDNTLVLTTRKPNRSWTLKPAEKPGRIEVSNGGTLSCAAEVVSEPESMLLALWGRLGAEAAGLEIAGEAHVAHHLLIE